MDKSSLPSKKQKEKNLLQQLKNAREKVELIQKHHNLYIDLGQPQQIETTEKDVILKMIFKKITGLV